MKKFKFLLLLGFSLLCTLPAVAQNDITTDTLLATKYFKMAAVYENKYNFDSAIICYNKAIVLFKKHQVWDYYLDCLNYAASNYQDKGELEIAINLLTTALDTGKILVGENSMCVAISNQYLASCYSELGYPDKALEYYNSCLHIQIHNYGLKHLLISDSYLNIAVMYDAISEFDSALFYFFKGLNLRISLAGDNNMRVAVFYSNIAGTYMNKGNYPLALEYNMKSLTLKKALTGETKATYANTLSNIGNNYFYLEEYNLALEYYLKALTLKIKLLGEKHKDVALTYTNIANLYSYLDEYETALNYAFKALKIRSELYGENYPNLGYTYNEIADIFAKANQYDSALKYFRKALNVLQPFYKTKQRYIGALYNNFGHLFQQMSNQDSALYYFTKAAEIYRNFDNSKNPNYSTCVNSIASVYFAKNEFDKALYYNQLSLIANSKKFNDSLNLFANPVITDYFEYSIFLKTLDNKAVSLYKLSSANPGNKKYLSTAIDCHKKCDQLIDKTRKTVTTQADKIRLGSIASLIYENAIMISLEQYKRTNDRKFLELGFYYSEKNKGGVLLDAIAGQAGLKFSGIPDSLLLKEQNLKIDIAFYEKKLAELPDSATEIKYRNRLFALNREYDQLIANFEKEYPDYYKLKYNTRNPSVKDIQRQLDHKTAIRSYFLGEKYLFCFTLSNKHISYSQQALFNGFDDSIKYFRYGLTQSSKRMAENYARLGYFLYKTLFPEGETVDTNISHYVIIPDGSLGYVPFEALLTSPFTANREHYKNYPYLINSYTISYSYSANLYYLTYPKEEQKKVAVTNLNDWIALAPVFSDDQKQAVKISSRELERQMGYQKIDSLNKRGTFINGGYVAPLPGTETETEAIFDQFEGQKLKASVMLYQNANEPFIKHGGLNNYRMIHFATHGFVNPEKPELSGILLNQDTSGGEDGVLYTGEIYNLRLNADLTVLSACETGLGKIKKGEGIIGLTRALLYAGSKNVIVSLWQVSDQSTSDLMIDFYKIYLQDKQKTSYSESLRQAKLNMIRSDTYSRPFYWSPFILIGN